jgi:hypothetical protein
VKYWITPSLALTDDSLEAMDPGEALMMVLDGDEAYISHTRIEDAYWVLARLGLSDDEIANKIDFALGLGS